MDTFATTRIIDRDHPGPVEEMIAIHREILPDSLACRLGPGFMRRFYYSALVKEDIMLGVAACMDGKMVALVTGTADADGFMRRGVLRRPFLFAWTMVMAIVTKPARLGIVLEAAKLFFTRSRTDKEEGLAEIFTLVVLPEYTEEAFRKRMPEPFSLFLGGKIMEMLLARGAENIRTLLKPTNARLRKRIESAGWRLHSECVPGWEYALQEYRMSLKDHYPMYAAVVASVESRQRLAEGGRTQVQSDHAGANESFASEAAS